MATKPKKESPVHGAQHHCGSTHNCGPTHQCGTDHQTEKMETTPVEKTTRSKDKKDNCEYI